MVKRSLVKHQKLSKYYEKDCVENFLLLFKFLLTGEFVINSHIKARIYFVFLKIILTQTRNFINVDINISQSYQGRQILALFRSLIALVLR